MLAEIHRLQYLQRSEELDESQQYYLYTLRFRLACMRMIRLKGCMQEQRRFLSTNWFDYCLHCHPGWWTCEVISYIMEPIKFHIISLEWKEAEGSSLSHRAQLASIVATESCILPG